MKLLGTLALLVLMTTQPAFARSECAPAALAYAITAFQSALKTGVTARTIRDEVLPLGSNISVGSYEVQDVRKNSFVVRFHLESVNHQSSDLTLVTTLSDFDRSTCKIRAESLTQLENPHYTAFFER